MKKNDFVDANDNFRKTLFLFDTNVTAEIR